MGRYVLRRLCMGMSLTGRPLSEVVAVGWPVTFHTADR